MLIKKIIACFTAALLLICCTGCRKAEEPEAEMSKADSADIRRSMEAVYNSKCESCRRIAELRMELVDFYGDLSSLKNNFSCISFIPDNLIPATFNAETDKAVNEIESLKGHECSDSKKMDVNGISFCIADPNPPVNLIYYSGTYSGEWQSGFPNGEGVFSGSMVYDGKEYTICYSGDWVNGAFEGQGEYVSVEKESDDWIIVRMYSGGLKDFRRNGSGTYLEQVEGAYSMYVSNGIYRDDVLSGDADYSYCNANGEVTDYGTLYDWGDSPTERQCSYTFGQIRFSAASVVLEQEWARRKEQENMQYAIAFSAMYKFMEWELKKTNAELKQWTEQLHASSKAELNEYFAKKEREEAEAQAIYENNLAASAAEAERQKNYNFWSSQYESDLDNYGYYNPLTEESERNMYKYKY